jgi:hypothetical protein
MYSQAVWQVPAVTKSKVTSLLRGHDLWHGNCNVNVTVLHSNTNYVLHKTQSHLQNIIITIQMLHKFPFLFSKREIYFGVHKHTIVDCILRQMELAYMHKLNNFKIRFNIILSPM